MATASVGGLSLYGIAVISIRTQTSKSGGFFME